MHTYQYNSIGQTVRDDGLVVSPDQQHPDNVDLQAWVAAGNVVAPAAVSPLPPQYDLDVSRYTKRAGVKDRLLAEMAADNMARVRSGVWTVVDLTDLMADPDVKSVLELIGTLSFELAAQAMAAANHTLLTPTIKAGLVAKLQAHLYLVP